MVIKLKGRLGGKGRQHRSLTLYSVGPAKPHITVVQYLPYGSTANFRALTDLLLKREEQWNGNSASDLCGIKIIKIS